MAANFVTSSSQRLVNTAPGVLDYPITVGCWVWPINTNTECVWSLCDTANDNHFFKLRKSTVFSASASAGGTELQASTAASFTINTWNYVVARFVSSTNRHVAAILSTGEASHGTNTTARAPTGLDTMSVGSRESATPVQFLNGLVAEFWVANIDIQADGAQLQDALLRQLAYGGPFSVPHIVKNIIEYRSFLKRPTSDADDGGEIYHGSAGRQTWTNTNGVTTGPHPPLPYWCVKPNQVQTELVI